MLQRISIARVINETLGGVVITPWELDQLNDEWMDVFQGLAFDLPEYKAGTQQVEDIFAKWRKGMNYR